MPEGWTFEDYNEYETFGITREDTTEFNKRESCTHTSKGTVQSSEDPTNIEGTEFVNHFCFPFDYQFLAKEESSKSFSFLTLTLVNQRPYLMFQVNSVDSWNRHRIQGYGFVRLPLEPGYHEIEIETWKPRGSMWSEIHGYFLGGSIRVLKLEELIRTKYLDEYGKADIVNRFGLET